MSTTITGKLNDNAREFQAGNSTGFGFKLGVKYYNRETKQSDWTNYEGAIFLSNENQINFVRSNMCKGAIIQVTADKEYIKLFEGRDKTYLSIGLIDCKLGFIHFDGTPPPQPPQQGYQQAPQQGYQQQPQAAPQQPGGVMESFDDDIPF
jgi:hypothetical protein